MRGSLFSPLGHFLAGLLLPFAKGGSSYVENSAQVKNRLNTSWNQGTAKILASFDVVNLFTKVPVQEALEVLEKFLKEDDTLAERTAFDVDTLCRLIKFVLTSCYFLFGSDYFIQTDGVAMGSNLGCVVANVYMRFFEEMALSTAANVGLPAPFLWLRYVDDVLCTFTEFCDVHNFLIFLNSLRAPIQFTLELEKNDCIPFLDLFISKRQGNLLFSVYRKPTHTGKYLNRSSCHPPSVFKGLVTCLRERASSICSGAAYRDELGTLRRTLAANGYDRNDLQPLRPGARLPSSATARPEVKGVLPYIPGLSNRLKCIFKRVGVHVGLKPPPKLGSVLTRKKPKAFEPMGLIYLLPCSMCDWSYVGETSRTLKERLNEHKRLVRTFSTSSEVANHVLQTGHSMNWEAARILNRETQHYRRIIKEAWFTRSLNSGNKVFFELDPAWQGVLK